MSSTASWVLPTQALFLQPKELWTYFKWISLEVQTQSRSVGSIEDHLWRKSSLPYHTKSIYSFLFLFRSIKFGRKSLVKVYQFILQSVTESWFRSSILCWYKLRKTIIRYINRERISYKHLNSPINIFVYKSYIILQFGYSS